MSAVAGIVDRNGGLRVVVTQRWRMRYHVKKHERLFVVPDYEVEEPVPWKDVPQLIERVHKYTNEKLAPINRCGSCRQCCFTMHVRSGRFEKPSGQWCHNIGPTGCKIYAVAPGICHKFKCMWRASQERNDRMAESLRPDRCGAIFTKDSQTNDPLIIEVHGEPDKAAWTWINEMQAAGYRARKIINYIGEKR